MNDRAKLQRDWERFTHCFVCRTFFNRHFLRFDSCMADAFFVLSSSLITIFCRQVQWLSGYPIEQLNEEIHRLNMCPRS